MKIQIYIQKKQYKNLLVEFSEFNEFYKDYKNIKILK